MKLNLMIIRWVYLIALWIVFNHKLRVWGRLLVVHSMESEADYLSLNSSFPLFSPIILLFLFTVNFFIHLNLFWHKKSISDVAVHSFKNCF